MEGKFPELMKLAEVVPLYKSKEMDIVINYRPISLQITISKVLEKIIYKRVYSFLEWNSILYNSQYGFRTNHNCEQAIMELASRLLHAKERGKHSAGIFSDLSKVFDTLNHTVLLSKLERLAIRGVANKWFSDYLSGRSLVVKITVSENRIVYSEPYQITYGTAQGSCLGPLLFILFCNDIYNLLLYSHLILFADDTTMVNSHKNLNYLEYMMYHDLTILLEWFSANQLSLNLNKTMMMNFWPGKKKINIQIDDITISPVTHCKFLGVHINENLNWNYHMEYLHNRITTNLHLLQSSKNILNTDSLRKAYYAHVHSHLIYDMKVWGSMISPPQINSLYKQQKQGLRLIGKQKSRENTDPTFRTMNILKLPDMIQLEMYKLGQQIKFKKLPKPIIEAFNAYGGKKIHRYPTRNKNLPNIQRHQGTIFNKSFLCRGIAGYMLLPIEIQNITSQSTFTKHARKYLMMNY